MKSCYAPDDVLIVAALRSPVGKLNGAFKEMQAHELGGQVAAAVLRRGCKQSLSARPRLPIDRCRLTAEQVKELDPFGCVDPEDAEWLKTMIDSVIVGQVYTAGGGQNPARQTSILAGLPFSVPAWGVNQLCGSGLLAVGQAFDRLKFHPDSQEMALAGGQECMSKARALQNDLLINDGLRDAFSGLHMGLTAENLAMRYAIDRQQQDAFALQCQTKYQAARDKFQEEICPIGGTLHDEFPRLNADLAQCKVCFPEREEQGFPANSVTVANATGLNDGAAFVLLAKAGKEHNWAKETCRIVAWSRVGCRPELMGMGPVLAVQELMTKTGWSRDSVQRWELNEAFAVQSLVVIDALGLDPDRVNVNGGALAIGHPLGCSGARILVTLCHEMARLRESSIPEGAIRGVASLCVGGGMGIAMAVERLH